MAVLLCACASAFAGEVATIGATKRTGAYVAVPQFENAGEFSEGRAAVKVDGKWGFIDKTGRMIIEPQFNPNQAQFNGHFSDGLVAVNFADAKGSFWGGVGGVAQWGFADRKGAIVINPQFEANYYSPPVFSDGLAPIRVGFKWGFIDTLGRMAIAPTLESRTWFSEGMAPVKVGDKEGYIDKSGKMVIEPRFDFAGPFSEGLAQVTIGTKSGYIDKAGNTVIELRFDMASSFREGLAKFGMIDAAPPLEGESTPDGSKMPTKFGYIDKLGRVAIAPQFPVTIVSLLMGEFSEGLAVIEYESERSGKERFWADGKSGFIDRTGKFVINPKFDDAWGFSEGLAAVRMGPKWGYIDKAGHMVVTAQFDQAGSFKNGVARVQVGGKFGFIAR